MRLLRVIPVLALSLASLGAAACEGEEGSVSFTTWGEEYIEREIPASDVLDGWSVAYTKFLVVVGDVAVAAEGASPVARMTTPRLFDMHRPGVKPVFEARDLEAKAYPHVSFTVSPATPDVVAVDVPESDRQLMVERGYSVYVEGSATKGAVTKRFAWGFGTSTLYDRCEGEVSGKTTEGVVVTSGGTDVAELTIHGDHLFYDDLQSPDARLRFDALAAADANADGEVSLDELAAVELARIPAERGPFGTGSAAGIHDLRAFVTALSRTLGHFRGEGECISVPR